MNTELNEICWTLVGQRRGRIWKARRKSFTEGLPHRVTFDADLVLAREEKYGDIVGFYHTHPVSPARPSQRDLDTMRAWASCLGKPLLCLIDGSDGLEGFRFDNDESSGAQLEIIEQFARGVIVAVEK